MKLDLYGDHSRNRPDITDEIREIEHLYRRLCANEGADSEGTRTAILGRIMLLNSTMLYKYLSSSY